MPNLRLSEKFWKLSTILSFEKNTKKLGKDWKPSEILELSKKLKTEKYAKKDWIELLKTAQNSDNWIIH